MPNELKDETKIYLQVENPDDDGEQIDILNVVSYMAKRKRTYRYLMAIAVFIGVLIGLLVTGVKYITGKSACAQAVITFQYDGIEEGLDPNGAAFDINKLKAPVVIESALESLGNTDISVEDVRQNIVIEGVIPEDAVDRITVIKQMALEDATNYEKILDVSYFPSQYVVSFYKDWKMSGTETTEILNAVLESYREWFLDTYTNTAVLTVTGNMINYQNYDYAEAVDIIKSQVEIMQNYVAERLKDAPDFRSANTGLSFGDIQTSLNTIESIDLAKLVSYVENNNLTKDKQRLIEYYNYNIKEYTMNISELQSQLSTVQTTIDGYVKDPVVIVSSQESTQEITQKDEYYDSLLEKKIDLSNQISQINTKLNKTYTLLNNLQSMGAQSGQKQQERADAMLESITATLSDWTTRIENTTEEYYTTTQFSNAYKISVPAQYQAAGGLIATCKTLGICVAAMLLLVLLFWGMDGLRMEIAALRSRHKK
ncbi:MAG: hypothetical protein MR392_04240 [Roseburia sp.]|nr:hypothetical protein [Roseburia sp.]